MHNHNKLVVQSGDVLTIVDKFSKICDAFGNMAMNYSRLQQENAKLSVEQERLVLMRQEILVKYQTEKEKMIAEFIDRNTDRIYIQGILNKAIEIDDKELRNVGLELYKAFLELRK